MLSFLYLLVMSQIFFINNLLALSGIPIYSVEVGMIGIIHIDDSDQRSNFFRIKKLKVIRIIMLYKISLSKH